MTRARNAVLLIAGATAIGTTATTQAGAQQFTPDGDLRLPFTAALSHLAPLALGMDVSETSHVLQEALRYVGRRPGDATYPARRHLGGSGLIVHHGRLFLKFRRRGLTGWKDDWANGWMWR